MYESSGRLNKPYSMVLTHIFAKHGILEIRHSGIFFLDAKCLGYCGLINIGDTYYMKWEFQNLDVETRAENGPRRSMSSIPSSSQAQEPDIDDNEKVPIRATTKTKCSESASHTYSAKLMCHHSQMASSSKNPFKKFKKFFKKHVVDLIKKI
ncbi:unnamed protein product [Cuscuta campestris]|uniref:Uncharacterized protein n=1 Tax=Cuscuta campestris TaxID=132261 RepID=A0A484NPS4_9ASTE|nr:unnamed protein product [Cuscuta campestris]